MSDTINLATMPDGWYWVKTLKDTARDFWSPAYLCHNDKPSGTLTYWLDSWLDGLVEPTEIGPRILAPDEAALAQPARAPTAGVAELVAQWRAEAFDLVPNSDWDESRRFTLNECADALAALNGGDDV